MTFLKKLKTYAKSYKDLKHFIISLISLMSSFATHPEHHGWAQVNVEQSRPKDKEGFSATLDSSLTFIQGNVDLTQIGMNGRVEYVRGVHSPFIQASIQHGEKSGETFLNQSFGHARWTAMWWDHLGSEVFAQLQENSFRSLVLRQLYGGGVRLRFSHWDSGQVAVGVGAMYEHELYIDGEGSLSRERRENNLRATNYLTLKQVIQAEAELTLSSTLYYQPLLNLMSDYRLLYDLSCEVKLSQQVRLVESFHLLYDTAPPQGVKGYDLKSITSLRLAF